MPRPLFDSEYLYGFHDPGGEHVMLGEGIPGWVLFTTGIGHDPNNHSGASYSQYANQGLGVMVRLNNGYGNSGTIPYQYQYDEFASRCANFVRSSSGCRVWIVGNEMNHPIERPGADWNWNASPPHPSSESSRGEVITPQRYASCYKKVRQAIHRLSGHENDLVLVGAVAPWNILTTYTGNENGDWILYFRHILEQIGAGSCDGITVHTYTHGTDADLIRSSRKVGDQRFKDYHWDFRTYRDFMNAIPATMQHLPVYITETDQGDDPWLDRNSGWVKAAYGEIDDWNKRKQQKIRSLILYRWPKVGNDRWYISGKSGVIEDFREALAFGYKWTTGPKPDDDALSELWKRLETLEAKFKKWHTDLQNARQLRSTLADEQAQLRAGVSQLERTDFLLEQLQYLAGEVANLESQVVELAPIIIPPDTTGAPDIQDVSAQLPQHSSKHWAVRSLNAIKRIVIHNTVTSTGATLKRIAEVHVGQGKPGIAYHYLIQGDGAIYATQPQSKVVLQSQNSDINSATNVDSVAVAFAGDFRPSRDVEPSDVQRQAAAHLIAWIIRERNLTGSPEQLIFGRNELGENVGSPGSQWLNGVRYKDKLLADVQAYLAATPPDIDAEELAALRKRVAELEAQVINLESEAAKVPLLQSEIGDLQITISQQAAEIELLHEIIRQGGDSTPAGLQPPEIIDIVDELPKNPTLRPYSNRTQAISKLVVHHTDTPKDFTVQKIADYHVFGKRSNKDEWPGIGYHYVITAEGTIYWSQRHETRSYHVGPGNNYCLGVSLIGRFLRKNYDGAEQSPEDQLPTPAQVQSASHLIAWLMQELKVNEIANVVGHKEVSATTCPGDQWTRGVVWKETLHQRIQSVHAGKPIPYYLLFWDHKDSWAYQDWQSAHNYIAHFRPTTGFSLSDAMHAQRVIIVGGHAGASGEDEALLRSAGADVYRLAGTNESATRAMLDDLVAKNTPWPGAPTMASQSIMAGFSINGGAAQADEWTIPEEAEAAAATALQDAQPTKVRVESNIFPSPVGEHSLWYGERPGLPMPVRAR
ncbi:MAG: hypothetical protein GY762_21100 [Proteobacteria bacterium]|nr:hypothetical protein [Pseudomonadota bacterium]